MGTGVYAKCRACGYRDELRLGAGRSDFLDRAEWPVWCDDCGKMDTTNYKQRPLSCYHCQSTNVTRPEAKKNTRMKLEPVITWLCRIPPEDENDPRNKGLRGYLRRVFNPPKRSEDLGLHNGLYRCPDCSEHQLYFSAFMQFD